MFIVERRKNSRIVGNKTANREASPTGEQRETNTQSVALTFISTYNTFADSVYATYHARDRQRRALTLSHTQPEREKERTVNGERLNERGRGRNNERTGNQRRERERVRLHTVTVRKYYTTLRSLSVRV